MNRKTLVFWSLLVSVAFLRLFFSLNIERPDIGNCLGVKIIGEGVISVEPERKSTGQVFTISENEIQPESGNIDNKLPSCGNGILIRVKTKLYPRFSFGDSVQFSGKLSKPFNFHSGSGRSFDYEGYLAKDNVFYEIKSADVKSSTSTEPGQLRGNSIFSRLISGISSLNSNLSSGLYSLKRKFVNNLERSLGEPHAALASGLVVGEKSALGTDLIDDFRTVGLIHIVVLSGYNITIVADALRRLLSFLPRTWGIVIGGIGIGLFGILVGGGATVVRSCVMAGIALSADLIRREYNVARALALAALLMLIESPLILLHDPSFQLSFLATLGLILLASPVEKRLKFIPEKFGMRGIVASTIATQIFVSPFILYIMGQISIIGMVVNILVLPFIPITMLLVFLTGVGGLIWNVLSVFFGWGAHILLSYELFMVTNFAKLPFAAAHVPAFSGWWVAIFYFCIISLLIFSKKKKATI